MKKFKISVAIAIGVTALSIMSCGKGGGNAPSELLSQSPITPTNPPSQLPTDGDSYFALAYGSTASDRTFLNSKINGHLPPSLAEIFNNWRRIAAGTIYNDISIEPKLPAYCFSGFNSYFNWNSAVNPANGGTVHPGTHSECVNSNVHTSNAWNYITSPDRLYNASNASSFIGFLSGLQFKDFNLEAVVSSADTDDDAIGLIIASTVVGANVHTLTALRTQGGQQPTQGWAIVHRTNNIITRIFSPKSVGGTNQNSIAGDRLGWNGRNTRIRVERADNIIRAYASTWGTGGVAGAVDPASEITIDLNDGANSLTQFQGPQYYGYGTISQLGATFAEINFVNPTSAADPTYIYDLANNTVYIKNISGGYTLMIGTQAYSTIGFPKKVKNAETQKEFTIDSAGAYTEL
jgi:hypothetical protein